ncbi:Ku protein [Candidatus Falkowbacteria bacterium RBG_13_39_14]|uniref:Non-homologous end joining protein Ku n=1 Tax=Candidatus Falkowbacteria bacterium RBG_13_39_14 TaxID=1797985 RepID=A0A1F5S4U9_9BACT|nr:MAG: Ku protein [Candidatus Falkowbacteria bacterium RBG_13_39_14]
MRSIWSGGISFGLIYIPVKLYTAVQARALKFHYLRKKDLCPVGYVKTCRITGEEVSNEDIIRGYEYQKGNYVILEKEDFEKANVKKTKSIQIHQFVKENEIDTAYFEKPFYLEPAFEAKKTYALLREALAKTNKAGLASFVLHSQEHLAVLKPKDEVLLLNQIRYKSEFRDFSKLDLPAIEEVEIKKEELEMAINLINQLAKPLELEKFKDTYAKELKNLIQAKIEGREIRKEEAPRPTAIPDLMEKLKASLEQVK